MARDENDRPYEDGQGRPLNPEMTGDVLSPRWSTEDTDEQPAIQVVGNETYILPLEKGGEPQLIERRDVLDDPGHHDVLGGTTSAYDAGGSHDVLDGGSGPRDVLGGGDPHDVLGGGSDSHRDVLSGSSGHEFAGPSGPHDFGGPSGSHDFGGPSGPHDFGGPSGPHEVLREPGGSRHADDEPSYLPLDRGYETDDRDDDKPKRGFLGSGWTDESGERRSSRGGDDDAGGGEGEVRHRTRVLLVAAAAVVLVGVGVGWMVTGTSSDDPCAGGRCASAGEVTAPSDSAVPSEEEQTPVEEETDTEPSDPAADEPTDSDRARPERQQEQTQPTREPQSRPSPTRDIGDPTTKASPRNTRAPQDEMRDTDVSSETRVNNREPRTTSQESQDQPPATQPTQAPVPEPEPTEEERKGLLDILFPWA
ncbi:hypothetical protein [Nonomuraea sp. KM88]|uniref:hypothetical protein n=1 Tax=Nonomuraea sp. KM88 TaxID=3457427 RepID=UPI003FCD8408